jgi:FKBP-type peptidyl-prolyl cis-trans isomerase FklB
MPPSTVPSSLSILVILSLTAFCWFPAPVHASTTMAGWAFLKRVSRGQGIIVLDSGMLVRKVQHGTGTVTGSPNVPVTLHYVGGLMDGTIIDDTHANGGPRTVLPRDAISGMAQALDQMVQGDIWEIYIPSELGYGDEGIPGVVPPGEVLTFVVQVLDVHNCPFCSADHLLYHHDLVIPGSYNQTCADWARIAALTDRDSEQCDQFQAGQAACCQGIATCSLCPNDEDPLDIHREIGLPNPLPNLLTCQDYWFASYLYSSPQCLASVHTNGKWIPFDLAQYCGCPNVTASDSGSCGNSLCGNQNLINDGLIIDNNVTCAMASNLMPYFYNETCDYLSNFSPACCEREAQCSMCSTEGDLLYPDTRIPYDNGTTCEDVFRSSLFLSREECKAIQTLGTNTIDLKNVCGCPDADGRVAKDSCTYECISGILANPDTFVDRAGMTCQELYDVTPHLLDSTFCGYAQEDLELYCCNNSTLST